MTPEDLEKSEMKLHQNALKFYGFKAQIELMDEIISKIESMLINAQDLMYLTGESCLKIMLNDFLAKQCNLLDKKKEVMIKILEGIK